MFRGALISGWLCTHGQAGSTWQSSLHPWPPPPWPPPPWPPSPAAPLTAEESAPRRLRPVEPVLLHRQVFPPAPFLSQARAPGSTDTLRGASSSFCVSGLRRLLSSSPRAVPLLASRGTGRGYDCTGWGGRSRERCHLRHVASRVSAIVLCWVITPLSHLSFGVGS